MIFRVSGLWFGVKFRRILSSTSRTEWSCILLAIRHDVVHIVHKDTYDIYIYICVCVYLLTCWFKDTYDIHIYIYTYIHTYILTYAVSESQHPEKGPVVEGSC